MEYLKHRNFHCTVFSTVNTVHYINYPKSTLTKPVHCISGCVWQYFNCNIVIKPDFSILTLSLYTLLFGWRRDALEGSLCAIYIFLIIFIYYRIIMFFMYCGPLFWFSKILIINLLDFFIAICSLSLCQIHILLSLLMESCLFCSCNMY